MKYLIYPLFLLFLFSCDSPENKGYLKRTIEMESQLYNMNIMLCQRSELFASHLTDELITTPKTIDNQSKRGKLEVAIKQINQIDSLTINLVYFLDHLKIKLLEEANEKPSTKMIDPNYPILIDLTSISSPSNSSAVERIFNDTKNEKKTGTIVFERLKEHRKKLVGLIVNDGKNKMNIISINNYQNEKELLGKITSLMEKVPDHLNQQAILKDIYYQLTLPSNIDSQTWEHYTFDSSTLIDAISSLTILQNKILNARLIGIEHIRSNFVSCSYGFDKIIPFAQGPSIIYEGETAEITVGVAAFDSYNQPEVTLESIDGEILKSEDGTGKVRIKPKKGLQKIKGTVSIKNKSGVKKTENWEWDIQVLQKK